jgi:hypothetical protein
VRLRATDGTWSSTFRSVVSVDTPSVPLREVAITQAEYFWDNDPGQGNGAPLIAFDGALDEAFEQGLANDQDVPAIGLHALHVRMRATDGTWSNTFRTVIAVEAPSVPLREVAITQAEYFWDNDPGEGNGTLLNASDGSFDDAVEHVLAQSTTQALSEGPHWMGLRVRGADGGWSMPFRSVVHLEPDPTAIRIAARMVLDGPYSPNTGLMNDALRSLPSFPLSEPYTALGYVHVAGGGESIAAAVLSVAGGNAIVDWVLVELRDANAPATVLYSRSALLQRDGDVVDLNGSSPVTLATATGSYHVALHHRNHLGVMTAAPLTLNIGTSTVDLTLSGTPTFGTDARRSITGAFPTQALWMGDVNGDNAIRYTGSFNDRDPVLFAIGGSVPTNTVGGYRSEDVNLDGTVKYTGENNDRDPILQAVGGSVPTNVREGSVP